MSIVFIIMSSSDKYPLVKKKASSPLNRITEEFVARSFTSKLRKITCTIKYKIMLPISIKKLEGLVEKKKRLLIGISI